MSARTTNLLLVLLIAAAATASIAYAHLSGKRDEAQRAARDAEIVRRDLAELARSGAAATGLPSDAGGADLNGRITAAASAAGVSGQLTGIEPSRPARVEGTDYDETVVFVHFQPLGLRQVASFLDELAKVDPAARPRNIELAAPSSGDASAATSTELWSPDVTLSYLTYSPARLEGTR